VMRWFTITMMTIPRSSGRPDHFFPLEDEGRPDAREDQATSPRGIIPIPTANG